MAQRRLGGGLMGDVAGEVANRIIELVDLDRMLAKVDLDKVLQRVDMDALLEKVDVDALVQRVDVAEIVSRVDVDAIVQRVDVDAIVERVDVNRILGETDMGKMVASSTTGLFTEILYLVRRQLVGLDAIFGRVVNKVLRRKPGDIPDGPPVSVAKGRAGSLQGHTAGALARLLAYVIDASLVAALFGLGVAATSAILDAVFSVDVSGNSIFAIATALGLLCWTFLYFWYPLASFGKTVGMGLVGVEVVDRDGGLLSGRAAAIRTVAEPLSFILWVGLIPIVTAKDRRALHDHIARTAVVYDWPASEPRYLNARAEREALAAASVTPVRDR